MQSLDSVIYLCISNCFCRKDDGVKVVSVDNLKNPYEKQDNFNSRFKLTLNKLYAWSLVSYERVVMLDSDNMFLQNTDELFQCGHFCAVFINPCIFHTGLFVLKVGLLNQHTSPFFCKHYYPFADLRLTLCYCFVICNGYEWNFWDHFWMLCLLFSTTSLYEWSSCHLLLRTTLFVVLG